LAAYLRGCPLRVSLCVAGVPAVTVRGGPLLGGVPVVVGWAVRVSPVVGFHGVDERGGARRSAPGGGCARRRRHDRRARAQRQGRRRRGTAAAPVRLHGVAQSAPVRTDFWGLSGALPHPVT